MPASTVGQAGPHTGMSNGSVVTIQTHAQFVGHTKPLKKPNPFARPTPGASYVLVNFTIP